jgi:hypothetical protein
MQGVHAYEDFYASHNHMPGSGRTMRVTGTVVFLTGGWSCALRETAGNTGINPEMLGLDLELEPPPEGAAVPEVLTPCAVEWSVDDPQIDYQSGLPSESSAPTTSRRRTSTSSTPNDLTAQGPPGRDRSPPRRVGRWRRGGGWGLVALTLPS